MKNTDIYGENHHLKVENMRLKSENQKLQLEKNALKEQLSLYGVSKRFCWLEMPKGKFSDSWDEETNSNFVTQDVIDYANKSGFKLIEYKCLNDEKFEFYKQMRLK